MERTGVVPDDADSGAPCEPTVPPAERCDGVDNDCDPSTADGSDEATFGTPCDGSDADLCEEGTWTCVLGVLMCSDRTSSDLDVCNGADDDCDPSTPDGSGDPDIGAPCDGNDSDLCREGLWSCDLGVKSCSDETDDTLELCNGFDDDCNVNTADGADESGDPCDGPDQDLCQEGQIACSMGSLVCTDMTDDTLELCNGLDDDCDGMVDRGIGRCDCALASGSGGETYLFCDADASWDQARSACQSRGLDLVIINDDVENDRIRMQIGSDVWIGLSRNSGGMFEWVDGVLSDDRFVNFDSGEPNGSGDCIRMRGGSGSWRDRDCASTESFVCESP